jgi:hypothetical protein
MTLPLPFLRCRTFGHAWDEVSASPQEQVDFFALWSDDHDLIVTDCSRCAMRRLDVVDPAGMLSQRRYTYPNGYLMARGAPRPRRNQFRLELIATRINQKAGKK